MASPDSDELCRSRGGRAVVLIGRMDEGYGTMRCFKIVNGHVSDPPVELIARTDGEAIAEAKGIAVTRNWAEFEVWDLDRAVFKHAGQ